MDDYLPTLLITVLCVNAVLFMGQASIMNLQAEAGGTQDFYNAKGSLLCRFDANGCNSSTYVLDDSDPASKLPSSEPIAAGDGSFFTDMFSSIKRFFTDTLGLGYLADLLAAPKNFLSMLGLPNEYTFALAALWYCFTLFVIVAFFWGR